MSKEQNKLAKKYSHLNNKWIPNLYLRRVKSYLKMAVFEFDLNYREGDSLVSEKIRRTTFDGTHILIELASPLEKHLPFKILESEVERLFQVK